MRDQRTVAPQKLLPTQGAVETGGHGALDAVVASVRQSGIHNPVQVIQFQERFYIFDGHKRVAAALILHLPAVPAIVQFTDTDLMPWGEPVATFLKGIPKAYKHDFEEFGSGSDA